MIKKILFACAIGIIFTIIAIQNQKDFQILVRNKIKELAQEALDCHMDFQIKSINLFVPTLEFENVYVKPKNNVDDWNWNCKTMTIKCSWLDYFIAKKFKANFIIEKYDAFSKLSNGNVAIGPHIKKLILGAGSKFPLGIKNLNLNKSKIQIYDSELNLKIFLEFKNELKQMKDRLKISLYLTNGNILKDSIEYANDISGTAQVNLPGKSPISADISGLCNLPFLNNEDNRCYFIGKWSEDNKLLRINSIDGKLNIGPIKFHNNEKIDVKVDASIAYIQKLINFQVDEVIEGECSLKLKTNLSKSKIKGTCILTNPKHNLFPKMTVEELKIKFERTNNSWDGKLYIKKNNDLNLEGNWKFNDLQKSGRLNLTNNTKIAINNWLIEEKALLFDLLFNKKMEVKSNYSCKIINPLMENEITSVGNLSGSKDHIKLQGNFNNQKYELACQLTPEIILKKFIYQNDDGDDAIKIYSTSANKIEAIINFDHVKNWLSEAFKQNLIGSGIIKLNGQYLNNKFIGQVSSKDLNLTVAKTYNIIKELEGTTEIDISKKQITLNDLNIKMYKGQMSCKDAIIIFDKLTNIFEPKFIYIPISLNSCFINWKKDVFATVSGNFLLQKVIDDNKFILNGFLLIDNAHIKNNIFSNEFRNNLLNTNILKSNQPQSNMEINIAVTNKNPIKVTTSLLNTQGNINLMVSKNVSAPDVSGTIDLIGGNITFPYKKLNITDGKIHFLSNQSYDPIINVTAKNKIKKYNVTMHITGSAQNHITKFESSPPLSEEQIITLLLVGSENNSMNTIVPSLVMNNIKNIISGSSEIQNKIKKYFDTFLKPFKYIRFVPSFSDETGRQGFRGAIEIDDNNRLHALIQKNFDLSEDTRFEVDYLLTDDVSIRGIKDERGDLGGEMELRWKF